MGDTDTVFNGAVLSGQVSLAVGNNRAAAFVKFPISDEPLLVTNQTLFSVVSQLVRCPHIVPCPDFGNFAFVNTVGRDLMSDEARAAGDGR